MTGTGAGAGAGAGPSADAHVLALLLWLVLACNLHEDFEQKFASIYDRYCVYECTETFMSVQKRL